MAERNDGGPAFPGQPSYGMPGGVEIAHGQQGMSLRDYFAGQVVGHIAHGLINDHASFKQIEANPAAAVQRVAETSYALADAMLAAREAARG